MRQERVVVACTNSNGEPDFYFCKVNCTDQQYENGEHYEVAKRAALDNDYDGQMVAYDDACYAGKNLMKMFHWSSATQLNVAV